MISDSASTVNFDGRLSTITNALEGIALQPISAADESTKKIFYKVVCWGFQPYKSELFRDIVQFEFLTSDALKGTVTKTDTVAIIGLTIKITLSLSEKKADLIFKWKGYHEVTETVILTGTQAEKSTNQSPPIMIAGERLDFIQIYPDTNITSE